MKWMSVGVMVLLSSLAQGQVLEGYVRDETNRDRLVGATVLVDDQRGAITDQNGYFRIEQIPPDRYQVEVGFVGYQRKLVTDVVIKSGQTTTLTVELLPRPFELEVVQVTQKTPFQGHGRRTITADQINRFASTYYDPARLVTTSPDVLVSNDQNNQVSVRGISPNYNVWRLEGVEIVNPNHLSNAGTFSDQPTQSGGGVNAISAQVMGNSSFEFGAMPSCMSNSVGGIFDLNLRAGTTDQYQFASQASLIGFDFMAEGPFGKKGTTSFLANYRYSFTGLLAKFQVDFGGEKIGFQDLTFTTHTRFKNGSSLKFFLVGADNFNYFDHRTVAETEREKDRNDIYYDGTMGIVGLNYMYNGWNLSWATSLSREIRDQRSYSIDIEEQVNSQFNTDQSNQIHSGVINRKLSLSRGFVNIQSGVNFYSVRYDEEYVARSYRHPWNSHLMYAGMDWDQFLGAHWKMEMGIKGYYSKGATSLDPRVRMNYLTHNVTYFVSAGRYSQLYRPNTTYFNRGVRPIAFDDMAGGFIRSARFIAGVSSQVGNWNVIWEGFYYKFPKVRVVESLATDASSKGVSLSLERNAQAGWYVLAGGSYFESTYAGTKINNEFNAKVNATLSGGKQWKLGSARNKSIDANLRGMYQGGIWSYDVMPVYQTLTYYPSIYYEKAQSDPYMRVDLRVQYVSNKAKSTRSIALDIQNVFNRENHSFPYYDSYLNKSMYSTQLGMIPILTYRVDF